MSGSARNRPNILWISSHDTSARNYGCYGDTYSRTCRGSYTSTDNSAYATTTSDAYTHSHANSDAYTAPYCHISNSCSFTHSITYSDSAIPANSVA